MSERHRNLPRGTILQHTKSPVRRRLREDMVDDWALTEVVRKDGQPDRRWAGGSSGSLRVEDWTIERGRPEPVTPASSLLHSKPMESISLAYFVDFTLTSGTGKVTAVQQLKQGRDERFSDFYRPVREILVDHLRQGGEGVDLDDFLGGRSDPREQRVFPKVISGYRGFFRGRKATWFEPPMRDWPLGSVSVRVAPELGLIIDGRPHAVKLYMRGDPISPQRVQITTTILSDALAKTWPGVTFGVLDVRRAKLYTHRPKPEIATLLRAEALALASLWAGL